MEYSIKSSKSKSEIIQILKNNTSEKRSVFYRNYDEFFNGKISEDSFKIQRNISYRNSFLPVIIGIIKETENGSQISIKMRLNLFVTGFMTFWFSFVIVFCLMMPFIKFDFPIFLVPYLMLAFGILLVIIPNKIETRKAKEKLEELLK